MSSASKIINSNPTFWDGANAEIKQATLDAVIRTAGESTTLNPTQSKQCLKTIHRHVNGKQPGSLTDAQHKVVCQALAKINDSGLIRCAIPPAPIKATRPSVLPDSKTQWEAQSIAHAYLRDTVRQLKKPESAEMAALALVYGLVMIGYGLEPAISIVSRLCQGDLEFAHNQLLRTPVHYLETNDYFHETVLPPWLRERFQRVARFNRKHKLVAGRHPAQQWAIHVTGPEPDNLSEQALYQWRFDQIKQRLIDEHAKQFSAWRGGPSPSDKGSDAPLALFQPCAEAPCADPRGRASPLSATGISTTAGGHAHRSGGFSRALPGHRVPPILRRKGSSIQSQRRALGCAIQHEYRPAARARSLRQRLGRLGSGCPVFTARTENRPPQPIHPPEQTHRQKSEDFQ